jgi:hypothetical protein
MSRLPKPGGDENSWGNILNDYLQQEHNNDGTHAVGKILGVPPVSDQILVSDASASKGIGWQSKSSLQGPGVAAGGTAGQILKKNSSSNYDTSWTTLDKSSVGLAQVDDTSDADKPISDATQTALSAKQPANTDLSVIGGLHPSDDDILQRKSGSWTNRSPTQFKADLSISKSDVGLGNADDTSDINKPVSTAQQAALNLKATKTDIVALATALG